jgi:hypothetical protein
MNESSLRIIAFTDFHGDGVAFARAAEFIRKGDWNVVIVAGDIVNYDFGLARQRLSELADAGTPLFFVPGNMDSPELASWRGTNTVRPLHGQSVSAGPALLVGLGGSPIGLFRTPFEIRDDEAERVMSGAMAGFSKGTRVLVSHCPPRNTKLDVVPSGEHVGSIPMRKFIEKFKPALVISGHIHEAKCIDSIGETMLINTGPARSGNCAEIALNDKASAKITNFL